ncbi:MAG: OmpA family protein [Alphaproteobacteria bacterium]
MRNILKISAALVATVALSACVAPVQYQSLDTVDTTAVNTVNTTIAQPQVVTTSTVATVPYENFVIRGTSFALDSDRLLSSGRFQLDDVANTMLSTGGSFNVTGYASTEGDNNYNLGLSERRARAVAAYLTGRGVPSSSLISTGAGETTQFGSDLASNRRVEISQLSTGSLGGTVISSTPIIGSPVVNSVPYYQGTPIVGSPVVNNTPYYQGTPIVVTQ